MARSKVLEITLRSVFVNENGAFAEETAANLLTATLLYPRPRIATRRTAKTLALPDAGSMDFDEVELARRLLFKETVRGPFPMVVELSVQLPRRTLPRVLARMLRGTAGAGLGLVSGGVGTPVLGAGADAAGRLLPRLLEAKEDERHFLLGAGSITVDPDGIGPETPARFRVILTVPETLHLKRTRGRLQPVPSISSRHRDEYRRLEEEVSLQAGDHAGSVEVELREV